MSLNQNSHGGLLDTAPARDSAMVRSPELMSPESLLCSSPGLALPSLMFRWLAACLPALRLCERRLGDRRLCERRQGERRQGERHRPILVLLAFGLVACLHIDGIAQDGEAAVDEMHWAYRPLSTGQPPEVQTKSWVNGAIDQYVLHALETKNLRPNGDADPRDLVRRISFQLTGLPPTDVQIDAYASDPHPATLARMVDQMLSSPRFGERWGRHWLDLARYADSNGLDENFLFREAWRYRNWVRSAIDADTPFDQFMLNQIAGDLLPYDSIEQRDQQRIAAGYLVMGPKVLLGNNENNQRMEVADELLDTIGRAVLGQTLGCARCHDHKFDPVLTADYYAMAGIFTSTSVMERRFMLGEQRVMERLVGLGEEGQSLDEAYELYYRELPAMRIKREKADKALALMKQARDEVLTEAEVAQFGDAVAPIAIDTTAALEQRLEAQSKLVHELTARLAAPPPIPPRAMIPTDVEKPADEHVRIDGEFANVGDVVPRGFLTVLCDRSAAVEIPAGQSGRLALSHWLCDGDSRSGQLAARVLANRIWHHLIGQGLVRTVDNFGITGEEPTHPQLLDYLAQRLITSGWSIKTLVREIVSSRTFQLSSAYDSTNIGIDPDNRLLWKANRRRLDPESLRDAMLAAAGELDLVVMGSTVDTLQDQATAVGANSVRRRTDFPCRSFYLPVIRNDLPEIFEAFDFADPHVATGARPNTTAPGQALFVMNNAMVMQAAEATARRLMAEFASSQPVDVADPALAMIDSLVLRITNRPANASVREALKAFVAQSEQTLRSEGVVDAELQAWTLGSHALFASSRFQFVE